VRGTRHELRQSRRSPIFASENPTPKSKVECIAPGIEISPQKLLIRGPNSRQTFPEIACGGRVGSCANLSEIRRFFRKSHSAVSSGDIVALKHPVFGAVSILWPPEGSSQSWKVLLMMPPKPP